MEQKEQGRYISWIIYILIWPVLILLHSFFPGGGSDAIPFFWSSPKSYYSTWLLDVLLVVIWYLNYYGFAPLFIKKRMYGGYIVITIICMVVCAFLQKILFFTNGWETPTEAQNPSISLFGAFAALAIMAVGLSVRGIRNWIKYEDKCKDLEKVCQNNELTITQLKTEIATLKNEAEISAKEPVPQPLAIDTARIDDELGNITDPEYVDVEEVDDTPQSQNSQN